MDCGQNMCVADKRGFQRLFAFTHFFRMFLSLRCCSIPLASIDFEAHGFSSLADGFKLPYVAWWTASHFCVWWSLGERQGYFITQNRSIQATINIFSLSLDEPDRGEGTDSVYNLAYFITRAAKQELTGNNWSAPLPYVPIIRSYTLTPCCVMHY